MALFGALLLSMPSASALQSEAPHESWSGIYPHLAFFNDENECGT